MGLESSHYKWWNPPLHIQQWENEVYFPFSFSKLGIPFLIFEKVIKESPALELAILVIFWNFPYLVLLLLLFLAEKLEDPLTFIWTPYNLWESPWPSWRKVTRSLRSNKKLVFMIVPRVAYQIWPALITK